MAYTFKHGDRPLDGITIQRAVGRGGFGEVYYAVSDAGKQLALKYLRDNPDIELRGIGHVMNLKSPHLVTVYDVRHSAEGEPFVIMEYISGPSLRDVLTAEGGAMPPEKAVFFLKGIAQGLAYLHERGIVHRDLKPGNIFYDDGYVKIGDYGLSKHISVSKHSGQTVSVGTVHYMAPEIGSGSYTKAIDIYSLGVILYEMLTGKLPFSGASMAEVLMRHLNDAPDTSLLPPGFGAVVAKALAKRPEDRYQDANEMMDALESLVQVEERLSHFDPTTLTHVPRTDGEAATRTSPPPVPPIPPLDARELRGTAKQVRRGAERIADRVNAGIDRLTTRLGRHARPGEQGHALPRRGRFGQILMLLLVTFGAAFGMAVISQQYTRTWDELLFALAFLMTGAVVGTLFAYFRILRDNPTRHWLFDRIVSVALAALAMTPGFAVAADVEFSGKLGPVVNAGIALCITLFICDWDKRIRRGRARGVYGDDAISPGILAFIVAMFVGAENLLLVTGVMAAMVSMLTQATAAMWPFPAGTVLPPEDDEDDDEEDDEDEDWEEEDARRGAEQARRRAAAVQPVPPPDPAPAPAAASPEDLPAQPSFASPRREQGLLAFVGKLAMTIGLLGALLYYPAQGNDFALPLLGEGMENTISRWLASAAAGHFPLLLVAGGVLRVLSRSRLGGAHSLRAAIGTIALLAASLLALGPASEALTVLMSNSSQTSLSDPSVYGPMALGGGLLLVGVLALAWPPAHRNQIVV